MAKLKVVRPKSFIGAARGINVYVNQQKMGKISNGKEEEYDIPAGSHIMACKTGLFNFTGSKDYQFTVGENENKTVFIKANTVAFIVAIITGGCIGGFSSVIRDKYNINPFVFFLALFVIVFACSMLIRKQFLLIKEF